MARAREVGMEKLCGASTAQVAKGEEPVNCGPVQSRGGEKVQDAS